MDNMAQNEENPQAKLDPIISMPAQYKSTAACTTDAPNVMPSQLYLHKLSLLIFTGLDEEN